MPPSVSVITVYYNTPDDLRCLVLSAGKFLDPDLAEFIVVDNASQQDLSAELPNVRYLRLPENGGFGKACNRGAKEATADVLFFVNPDCEFVEDCVTPLRNALSQAAVCGPRVTYPDGRLQLSFGPELSIWNEAAQRRRIRQELSPQIQQWMMRKGTFDADYVSGCALMTRADVFRSAGGFDENFFLYHEDVDLCKRIRSMGHSVRYVPSARIVHRKNTSASKEPELTRTEYRKSQLYYYKKHHGPAQNVFLKLYLAIAGKNV